MKIKNMLLVCLSVALLAGCSSNEKSNPETTASETNKTQADSKDLVSDGTIDLGTSADFPPYEFYDGDKIVGIDPEIAAKLSEKLGVEIKFHDMEFSSIIAAVESGKLDGGMSGFTITEERKQQVNFTEPYAESVQQVLLKEGSDIKSIDDLEGKKIGTQLGTTGDLFAQDDFGKDNVQSFAKYSDAVLALQNGKVDVIILDEQTAKKFAEANKDLTILDTAYAQEEYAMAIGKDNEALLNAINEAILELKESGELDEISSKYITEEK